jgi:hypothetical protein
MSMQYRRASLAPSPTPLPWLSVAGAFALGAAAVWLLDAAIQQMRPGPGPISDDTVLSRVQARIGQLISRPEAVTVSVENGVVRLAGDVSPEERDALLTQLLYMPGVVRLRSALGSSVS